jgi:hypothetical protein
MSCLGGEAVSKQNPKFKGIKEATDYFLERSLKKLTTILLHVRTGI